MRIKIIELFLIGLILIGILIIYYLFHVLYIYIINYTRSCAKFLNVQNETVISGACLACPNTVENGCNKVKILFINNEFPEVVCEMKSLITIGRDESNDIVIPDKSISRRHALLVIREKDLYIVDNNSKNGTIVNGYKIEKYAKIEKKIRVQMGRVKFFIERINNPLENGIIGGKDF